MSQNQESKNWRKRVKMSRFVQKGKLSFKLPPDPLSKENHHKEVFHILLKNGRFSRAMLTLDHFGKWYWQYPISPIEYLGGKEVWQPEEIVAWARAGSQFDDEYITLAKGLA